ALPHSPPSSPFLPYSHRHHPDLHSLPTRRSSDLPRIITSRDIHKNEMRARAGQRGHVKRLLRQAGHADTTRIQKRSNHIARATRSEEHTSELQSRFDLVCRLLLEKKKN